LTTVCVTGEHDVEAKCRSGWRQGRKVVKQYGKAFLRYLGKCGFERVLVIDANTDQA
jgi:hypothetical protein